MIADSDFNTVLAIVEVINSHNAYVFNMLSPSSENTLKVSNSFKSALRIAILDALPTSFETGMFAGVAKKFGIDARTVRRQIDRAIREGRVEKLARGSFKKGVDLVSICISPHGFSTLCGVFCYSL